MEENDKAYKRLPGRRRRAFGSNTLWMGPDHLLHIANSGYSENYRRFYYKDIQAVTLRKLGYWKKVNLALGALCAALFLAASLAGDVWMPVFLVSGIILLLLLLTYLLWGSTCECYLRTAVQVEKLPSLHRLRSAQRTMDLVQQKIESIQGRLTLETIRDNISRISQDDSGVTRIAHAPYQKERVHDRGHWHMVFFLLLLLYGLGNAAMFLSNHISIGIAGTLISLAAVISLIISLVKQSNSHIPLQIRRLTWTALGFACVTAALAYTINITVVFGSFDSPERIQNQWEMMKIAFGLTPYDSAFLLACTIFYALGGLMLGGSGVFLVRGFQKAASEQPATPGSMP